MNLPTNNNNFFQSSGTETPQITLIGTLPPEVLGEITDYVAADLGRDAHHMHLSCTALNDAARFQGTAYRELLERSSFRLYDAVSTPGTVERNQFLVLQGCDPTTLVDWRAAYVFSRQGAYKIIQSYRLTDQAASAVQKVCFAVCVLLLAFALASIITPAVQEDKCCVPISCDVEGLVWNNGALPKKDKYICDLSADMILQMGGTPPATTTNHTLSNASFHNNGSKKKSPGSCTMCHEDGSKDRGCHENAHHGSHMDAFYLLMATGGLQIIFALFWGGAMLAMRTQHIRERHTLFLEKYRFVAVIFAILCFSMCVVCIDLLFKVQVDTRKAIVVPPDFVSEAQAFDTTPLIRCGEEQNIFYRWRDNGVRLKALATIDALLLIATLFTACVGPRLVTSHREHMMVRKGDV